MGEAAAGHGLLHKALDIRLTMGKKEWSACTVVNVTAKAGGALCHHVRLSDARLEPQAKLHLLRPHSKPRLCHEKILSPAAQAALRSKSKGRVRWLIICLQDGGCDERPAIGVSCEFVCRFDAPGVSCALFRAARGRRHARAAVRLVAAHDEIGLTHACDLRNLRAYT